ncbi:PD-(D/E)XK nuclease family transposase [Sphingobacterium zeae]|uniref:Uncharacterized protein n=1 Tax=Sphingobacterium zeae TaxID=1776859 RepID=A0ABU0U759_9SPHI|nr:PD-(D/E)XK nuclease family transposase [Sphingobacterium zeae]MDQ1150797.1 hypothetical protein [Sphingobacterium zeae]
MKPTSVCNEVRFSSLRCSSFFQEFFKDRAVYYTSSLINKQLARGMKDSDYYLPEVYFIGILEFDMDRNRSSGISRVTERPYFYDVALCGKLTKAVVVLTQTFEYHG